MKVFKMKMEQIIIPDCFHVATLTQREACGRCNIVLSVLLDGIISIGTFPAAVHEVFLANISNSFVALLGYYIQLC